MTIIVTQTDCVRIEIEFAIEHTECIVVFGTFSRNCYGVFSQVRIAVDKNQGTRVILRPSGRYIFLL